jgi:hypothetical protein
VKFLSVVSIQIFSLKNENPSINKIHVKNDYFPLPSKFEMNRPSKCSELNKRPSLCIFQWLLVCFKTPFIDMINAHNKCDYEYTMRLATRVQVVEL